MHMYNDMASHTGIASMSQWVRDVVHQDRRPLRAGFQHRHGNRAGLARVRAGVRQHGRLCVHRVWRFHVGVHARERDQVR